MNALKWYNDNVSNNFVTLLLHKRGTDPSVGLQRCAAARAQSEPRGRVYYEGYHQRVDRAVPQAACTGPALCGLDAGAGPAHHPVRQLAAPWGGHLHDCRLPLRLRGAPAHGGLLRKSAHLRLRGGRAGNARHLFGQQRRSGVRLQRGRAGRAGRAGADRAGDHLGAP